MGAPTDRVARSKLALDGESRSGGGGRLEPERSRSRCGGCGAPAPERGDPGMEEAYGGRRPRQHWGGARAHGVDICHQNMAEERAITRLGVLDPKLHGGISGLQIIPKSHALRLLKAERMASAPERGQGCRRSGCVTCEWRTT